MAYEDLLKDVSESFEDGNYFIITVPDLDPNKTYELQFRWAYKDGTFGKAWSARKIITTPGESAPNTPGFIAGDVDVSQPEKIIITYRGVSDDATPVPITDIDRVDIYINGAPFDGSKPADSFKEAGTKIIPAPAGTYTIVLYAISKLGTKSPVSSPVTKTVIAATVPVEPPTLPSGLSVAAAPFAVSVNWNGTYSAADFDGFKSIDIHVRGSDVGSTATSGFSTTTQVATLTVNSTTNRQNIGLDNLRQALSLANNQAAYTSPMFFYYIARNSNDQLYSVSGTPTYTRINSTSVNPTQANFVDLASGVISIENLVAGNGQFSSWLRVGSAGGTRIELSGTNDFTNGGNTVQKGLVAYSSGSTEIFNLDIDAGTLAINGSGTFTGNLTIGSGNSVFKAEPATGIWLGHSSSASAPFSVSNNGNLYAITGTIGGWTLGSTFLQGNNIKLDTSQIIVGSTAQPYFDISPTALTHRNANGTPSGKFTLTLGTSSQLTMDGTLTLNGSSLATDAELSSGLSTKIGASDVNSNVTSISGGVITTGTINLNNVSINNSATGSRISLDSTGLKAYSGATNTVAINSDGSASFTGTITGSVITTTGGNSYGAVRMNTSTDAFEFLYSGNVVGSLYTFNAGSEILIQKGSPTSGGYATNTGFMSIYSTGVSLGRTNVSGILATGFNIDGSSPSITALAGSGGFIVSGGPIYTGTNTTTATDPSPGISLTQGGTISARRDNANPLNLNRFNVVAASTTSVAMIDFYRNGTARGTLEVFGNTSAPVLVGSSDYRLKENIRDYTGGLDKILSTKVRIFNEIEDEDKNDIVGFVAHEFSEIFPDFVSGEKDAIDLEGNPIYQKLSHSNMVPYLVSAIQELSKRLDELEG